MQAPPPDSNGYWYYTYVTFHPETGNWYGGKHATNNLRDGYIGSGNWIKSHPAKDELIIEIVEFFGTEAQASAAEAAMITLQVMDGDPFCRNILEGGNGLSSAFAKRRFQDPKWKAANSIHVRDVHATDAWKQGIKRRSSNQKWLASKSPAIKKAYQTPQVKANHKAGIERRANNPLWIPRRKATLARLRVEDPEWLPKRRKILADTMQTQEWKKAQREGCMGPRSAETLAKIKATLACKKAAKLTAAGQLELPL